MEISSVLQNKQAMAIVSLVAVVVLLFVIKRLILVRLKEKPALKQAACQISIACWCCR